MSTPISPMQGRRLPDDSDLRKAVAGDYFKVTWVGGPGHVEWWFRDPFGDPGRITKHTVEEHEDGTITVSPSIAPDPARFPHEGSEVGSFHGWLKAGVWSW